MKNKKVLIIILALVVVAGAAAYFMFFKNMGKQEEKDPALHAYVPGDYFVTNVKDSSHLLKVTVVLMLDTEELDEDLENQEYIIRDTIIQKLRALTEEDIQSDGIMDRLRTALTTELNAVLGINNIKTVKFSDFVMN